MSHQKTVIVGMSGGVDSSVAALLLKQQGYRVIGMFMKNWEETAPNGQCSAAVDYEDVAATCAQLNIPYYGVNFVEEYRTQVFSEFLRDYKAGFTPNPDILCNREIKFKVFFAKAMALGADYLATGHYCQIKNDRLVKGADADKDQTYFLNGIDRKVLNKVLFPVGHLKKSQVRAIAKEHDLPIYNKKDSTGICFIGERNFRQFLSQYIKTKPGHFYQLDGTIVGTHYGAPYYTIGQRKKLGLGGEGKPWFVVGKDIEKNIVYVERGDHPALYANELIAESPNWLCEDISLPLHCKAKIRYRQADQECVVEKYLDDLIKVSFTKPQRAIALRQSVAFYKDDECLGGATITASGPNFHELGRNC